VRYVMSTEDLAPADRFEFWRDMLAQPTFDSADMATVAALPPVRARTLFADSFTATLHATDSRGVSLVVTENDSVDVARTPAMIRDCDCEVFYLAVSYRGVQQLTLHRDVVDLRPAEMVLLHSSLPMSSRSDPHQRRQRSAMVLVDPARVPGGQSSLRHLLARPLSSQDSLVSLVGQHLYLLGTGEFHPGDTDELSALTSSLISLMLARQLGMERRLPSATRTESIFARIRSHTLARLSDPSLDADTVAAAHHISVRSLHRLFQARGLTVAAWIRQQRLERCRAELVDPAFADRPVRFIAHRWGYPEPSAFSRAYRATYGESPAATRAQVRLGWTDPVTG